MKKFILSFLLCIMSGISFAGIPVIMYHEVVTTKSGLSPNDTVVTISEFNKQMKWLHDNNYYTITVSQLAEYMKNSNTLQLRKNKQPIVITFDDGWFNQLNAIPALQRYGFTATFNIIASFPGNNSSYMNWHIIKSLHDMGFEIASHTMTHPDNMPPENYSTEILGSKIRLESILHIPIKTIAWPDGFFNDDMTSVAISSGYEGAQSIDENWCTQDGISLEGSSSCQWLTGNSYSQDPFLIKRVFVDGGCSMDDFERWVTEQHSSTCVGVYQPRVIREPVQPTSIGVNLIDDTNVIRSLRDTVDNTNDGSGG